jgi:ribosomal protein S18 acetylase RimI-like enzyme
MISLRDATPGDREFLHRLFAGSREELLEAAGRDPVARAALVAMQFDAQQRAYRGAHPDATRQVIEVDLEGVREPVGQFWVDRQPSEFRLLDISLLPLHRSKGIGSFFMRRLLEEAAASAAAVSLHVEQSNPALELYRRLAFAVVGRQPPYLAMRWVAAPVPAAPSNPFPPSPFETAEESCHEQA